MKPIKFQHQELANGRWQKLSFFEQMANVGSEVERALLWKEKNNAEYSNLAFERVLELLDLTTDDSKNRKKLYELLRLREVLVDYFCFQNIFSSSGKLWRSYFMPFNFAARINC